jgi:DNA polymerase III subunit delta'
VTTAAAVPWPPALAGTPAVLVIERAIGRGRLSHSLLLAGDDSEGLSAAALALADRLLNRGGPGETPYPPERHPDCIQVRPGGKSRSIRVDAILDMVGRVNVAATASGHKVVIIHEADRMNAAASNKLLKTLEEPPAGTTLLLLSCRPHSLLPTIRSRMLHFRFPGMATPVRVEGWEAWLGDYKAWLGRLGAGVAAGRAATDSVFALYGLLSRFGAIFGRAVEAEGVRRKASLPEGLDDEELAAIDAEISVGLRLRMFAGIEEATRQHARGLLGPGEREAGRAFTDAVGVLERDAGLLRLYINESAALEDFLLASLRIWTRR